MGLATDAQESASTNIDVDLGQQTAKTFSSRHSQLRSVEFQRDDTGQVLLHRLNTLVGNGDVFEFHDAEFALVLHEQLQV